MIKLHPILCCIFAMAFLSAAAEPTRQSLVGSWEANLKSDPQILKFEKKDSSSYIFATSYFPYQGRLKLLNASVQEVSRNGKYDYMGIIEIDLPDSSKEYFDKIRYSYSNWVHSQNMYFSKKQNKWVTIKEFQSDIIKEGGAFGYIFRSYSIFIICIVLIIVIWLMSGRRVKKILKENRVFIQESKARTEKVMQNAQISLDLSKQSYELHKEANSLLKDILEQLKIMSQSTGPK
jgi:hypothetical protein